VRRYIYIMLALAVLCAGSASTAAPIIPYLFDLNNYKGKVVYLDFWASWCGPCKFSFPYMDNLADRFRDRNLVILADNLDKSTEKAKSYLSENTTSVPIIYDPKGVLATRFKVDDMPTSILFDRQGKIRYVHKGFYKEKEAEYTAHVMALLNEK